MRFRRVSFGECSAIAIDDHGKEWDHPTMKIARADTKKRVVIPGAEPGDVFDVQRDGEERYVLVRLHRPAARPRMSRQDCLDAISRSSLSPTLPWEALRRLTREP